MSDSLLAVLQQELPALRAQTYFKSSLTALSHAIEDLVLAGETTPLVIANFQKERFYRQEVRRYQRISRFTDQVYVLAAPEAESGFANGSTPYEVIELSPSDELTREWHLVVIAKAYSACLICREQPNATTSLDQMRRFEGFWSFDRQTAIHAARWLLGRISTYRPDLESKVEEAWQQYGLTVEAPNVALVPSTQKIDANVFGQRLVTYLQAGQYKLSEAYRKIKAQEQRERLINTVTVAIRNSLEPQIVLNTTIRELGKTFPHCRGLLYRCGASDQNATIEYEFIDPALPSLQGAQWSLTDNPLIQVAMSQNRALAINDVEKAPNLQQNSTLPSILERWQIRAWLLVPIRYQGVLLGMIELHYGGTQAYEWKDHDIEMVEAIATQAGFALSQAQTCADLELANQQLKTIEKAQRNLIAIVGHELRTPLSTIRVCLESIEMEPDMPAEFLQTLLDTALTDSDRMRKLIQNFLTLSRLETGRSKLCLEPIRLQEVVSLALNSVKKGVAQAAFPKISVELPPELPTVRADGDGLVTVLTELLENACKFTEAEDEIIIQAQVQANDSAIGTAPQSERSEHNPMLEVIVASTGRGVEPSQVEAIFEWFSQEEDFLRRTVGGVGLGLAICRQLIQSMGGKVWAESAGKNQGSKFHFTLPVELSTRYAIAPA